MTCSTATSQQGHQVDINYMMIREVKTRSSYHADINDGMKSGSIEVG
jgi:hypothetical protein